MRHEIHLGDEDIVLRHGLACTSLRRTVVDIARQVPPFTAIACADAALRLLFFDGRHYDEESARAFRAEIVDVATGSRARGIRRAREIIAQADGRAASPGESVSRLLLRQIGFRHIELQVPVDIPGEGTYFVDFGLEDAAAWGEFDGEGKYFEEEFTAGLSPRAVLREEKRREDVIRGKTQRPFARWGSAHISSAESLRQQLAVFGVHPPR